MKDLTKKLTNYTTTRFYRAPEIILGYDYNQKVDLWSAGCIMGELATKEKLFKGVSRIDQLLKNFKIIGTPKDWLNENIYILDKKEKIKYNLKKDFSKLFPTLTKDGIDLLKNLLEFNPNKRISASDALKHPYFEDFNEELEEFNVEKVNKFDFEYEFIELSINNYKNLIYDEMLIYDNIEICSMYHECIKDSSTTMYHIIEKKL